MLTGPKYSKFNARVTSIGGEKFASKREAARWMELREMDITGAIRHLRRQVRYPLEVNGQLVCTYVADFVYDRRAPDDNWAEVIEDVKGVRTPVYTMKKKMCRILLGIEIEES